MGAPGARLAAWELNMIDHIGIAVSSLEASRRFYEHALAPLGYSVIGERQGRVGLGFGHKPYISLRQSEVPVAPLHIAIAAATRGQVDEFFAAAIGAGGTDNGAPGLRERYHPNYYGAFVLDPDGHNLEAVIHTPG